MIFSRILQILRQVTRRRSGVLALTLLACAIMLLTFTATDIVNAQGQERVSKPAHTSTVIPAWKKKRKHEKEEEHKTPVTKGEEEETPTPTPTPPPPPTPTPAPVIPAPKLPPTGSDPGSNPLP